MNRSSYKSFLGSCAADTLEISTINDFSTADMLCVWENKNKKKIIHRKFWINLKYLVDEIL